MNSGDTGWIKLHRKALDSPVFQNMTVWQVWSWCLMKASHRDQSFMFNGRDITVKRGSFITGREKALSEMPEISAQRYRTAINYLKSTSRIATKATNRFTIITVCKYDEYQDENLQDNQPKNALVTSKQPTNNQQITTYKNDKNIYKREIEILDVNAR
jgi:hypothetical protein